jgi:pimeloyl-ACP methyl ester carboxylesterase
MPRAQNRSRPRRSGLRRLGTVLLTLVLLAVVLLGAGGLYFAGQINSDGLSAAHIGDPQTYDLVVDAFTGGLVTLHRTGEKPARDDLATADEYGLSWPGGTGVLTGAPARAGTAIRRSLKVVTGNPPATGIPAALQRDVWPDPRAAHGVAFSDVKVPCPGGTCPAWFVPGRSSTWFIAVHGKDAKRTEPLRAMGPAIAAGLPTLDISYRNDPGAPADPDHQHAYGVTEWRDLQAAVGYATRHGAKNVVLFGSSMGGAIVASFLEHSPSTALVRGVMFDAPALDFRATVDWGAAHRTLPLIGTPIPGVLTATAEWMAGWRYGVDWNAMDYLPGSWLKARTLVVHGADDLTVPVTTSNKLKAAHPKLVQEVVVPHAPHVGSWNVDPRAYEKRESAFLATVLG